MKYEDIEHEKHVIVGMLLSEARYKNHITQQYVADQLHVSRRAIQAWERGDHPVPFTKAVDYFYALNEPMKPYLHRYMYGDYKDNGNLSRDELEKRGFEHVRQMTDHDLKCFDWIMGETHGSSSSAYLQKTVADLQSPLGGRLSSGVLIMTQYENAEVMGMLTDPRAVQPNKEILKQAINSAAESYRNHGTAYVGRMKHSVLLDEPLIIY